MATGTQGQRNVQGEHSDQGESEGLYERAGEALSDAADRASEMWDGAYDQGARYYRDVGGGTLGAVVVAAAVGYAVAWLIHGQTYSRGASYPSGHGYGGAGSRNRADYR